VYTMPGSPLFIGRTQVVDGTFSQETLIPRNVLFDRTGVRLIAYVWDGPTMGLGYDTSLVFHGSVPLDGVADTLGPVIALRPVGPAAEGAPAASFTDVVRSALPVSCEIVVMDENGIDVVGTGPDEGLTLEIPGVLSKRSISHTFQFTEGGYQQGTAPLVLNEGQVAPGMYQVRITARDLLENLSTFEGALEVVVAEELRLDQVFNYPNPMRMREGTRFYYMVPNSPYAEPASVVLKIYTLSGKLLRTVRQPENGWLWDGRDQMGNLLGPNVYLYRVSAWSGTAQEQDDSPIRKLVIHPPK